MKKIFLLGAMVYALGMISIAQNSGNSLGKIPVYSFRIDSLGYADGTKRLSAIGTEAMAELFAYSIGNNTYFKVQIGGESLAVTENPYGTRVSPTSYIYAWVYRDGRYDATPSLTHKAGDFFLTLPFSYSNSNTTSNANNSKPSTDSPQKKVEENWQLLGKIKVFSNMRVQRDGSESDVVFDEEIAFLYSSYSDSKIKYRISIPKTGEQHNVYENDNYNGAKVRYTSNGKRVQYTPSISEMFTHYAGKYYFNVDRVNSGIY